MVVEESQSQGGNFEINITAVAIFCGGAPESN
jgi:hypothetical protein